MSSPEITALEGAYEAVDRDTRALVSGLGEEAGTWQAAPGSWSVAECLDHLAVGNRVYIAAMEPAAARALSDGRRRRRPALPGLIGGWFVRTLEPPVKPRFKMKSPRKSLPRSSPPLWEAAEQFLASHAQLREFLRKYAEIDLAGTRFVNPFIPVIRFSLATGVHVLAAHERRHLWQAWNVRRAAERSLGVGAQNVGGLNPESSARR